MILQPLIAGFALAVGVTAQSTTRTPTSTASSTSTSSTAAATHTIAVGAGGFKFEPNNVTAEVGDTILFRFYPGGHSVVRSDFGYPCVPYELTGANHIGFFSNYQSPPVVTSNLPTFSIKINDTEPIFIYCSAPGSCKDHFMIGAINPNETQSLEKQEEYVRKSGTIQLAPGEPWPTENAANPTSTPTATSSSTAAAGGGGGNGSQQDQNSSNNSSSHLSAGAIAGIAIGGFAALVLAGALVFICGRKSRGDHHHQIVAPASALPPTATTNPPESPYPGMVDAKFHHLNNHPSPRSPGQATFTTTTAYAAAPPPSSHPPSIIHHAYPAAPPPPPMGGGSSPPISPNSYPTYSSFPPSMASTPNPNGSSGLMMTENRPVYDPRLLHSTSPPPVHPTTPSPPVELPASVDPGNSPLPSYQPRGFSFSQNSETTYRPSMKP